MPTPRVLATVWLPLEQAVLCLSCEAVYLISESSCPACGNRHSANLANWLQEHREVPR